MNQPSAAWVWLARIRKPQGRKGEVFAEILTDFPEKFAERKRLWLLPASGAPSSPPQSGGKDRLNTPIASGHDFNHADDALKGHGFSRAVSQPGSTGALAPEGRSPAASSACPVELLHHWLHKGGIVLHFAGIDSISAAETLVGLIVAIPQSERAALPEDEVHIADLIGCELVDVAGAAPVPVGRIESVDRSAGPVPLLIVQGAKGEVLIPFAKDYLRKLDLAGARIEMALPEGLADL